MRGTLLIGAWLLACASALPAGAGDRSIDPMSWDSGQWRGDLMESRHASIPARYRPQRFTRVSHIEEHIVIRTEMAEADETPEAAPRARLIRLGEASSQGVRVTRAGSSGVACGGILVVTWTKDGARPACHTRAGRVRAPVAGY